MSLPFGLDISKYQASQDGLKRVDFDRMISAVNPPTFIAIRSGQRADYRDPQFVYNWTAAKVKALPRIAYHVLEFHIDGAVQAQYMFDLVLKAGFDPTRDRLCLDLELAGNFGNSQITSVTNKAIEKLVKLTARFPLIYSRANWIDEHLIVSQLPKIDWWLAQYYNPMPPPFFTKEFPTEQIRIPRGVAREQIKFHQTSEKGNGKLYGAQSYYIDTDRYLGIDELRAYFGANIPPVISPEVKPLFQAKVIADSLVVRDAPSGKDTGKRLTDEDVVEVFEVSGNWYKIGYGFGWVSALWVERLDTQPPVDLNILNVPVFSQNDPRWKDLRLGTSGTTIGWNGCLISTQCSVAGYFGYDLNPASFNAWLTGHAGYTNGNLYNWDSLGRLYPLEIATWVDCYNIPAPLNKIDEALARKEPCVVHVDFVPSTNIVNDHYITIDGKLPDGDYHIVDSWDGWRGSFKARYANPARYIYRIVSYRRKS